MAKVKSKKKVTLEDALVPIEEHHYDLPENWNWVKIGIISDVYTGNSINERVKKEKYEGKTDGPLFIATKDIEFDNTINYETNIRITDSENFKKAPAFTSLLCIEGGSAGRKIGFTNQEVCFGNKLCAFSPANVESKYIFYYLQSNAFIYQFNEQKHGLIGGVSVRDLEEIAIPLPPLAEQQRIVERIESLFSKLDEAKEKCEQAIESFELRKKSLLHAAYTGELTKEWRIIHKKEKYVWEHKNFSEICEIVRGGSPRPAGDPKYYNGDIPFMKVADITNNRGPYVTSVEHSIKEAGLKKTRMVEPNTLLLTNSGATLGVPAISAIKTTFNDGIAAFLGLEEDSLLFYYYFWIGKTQELRSINMGAAQPNLNTGIIGNIEIDIPSKEEQKEIVRILERFFENELRSRESVEQVLDYIETMKKSILAKAFRGELGTNDQLEESSIELLKHIIES